MQDPLSKLIWFGTLQIHNIKRNIPLKDITLNGFDCGKKITIAINLKKQY